MDHLWLDLACSAIDQYVAARIRRELVSMDVIRAEAFTVYQAIDEASVHLDELARQHVLRGGGLADIRIEVEQAAPPRLTRVTLMAGAERLGAVEVVVSEDRSR